jgi:uncharacterized protein (TIGR00288 family)
MARDRKLLAVLIDADNIPAKYASAILKEITGLGEPALRRVYGDWSSDRLNGWRKEVMSLGLVANQETANTVGKNASDIGLVIDAMDILHTGRFDGFVLVSSDSDFTALGNRLREQGVEVIGIGESKAPVSLRNVCNRFILLENIIDAMAEKTTTSPKTKSETGGKQPPAQVVPLVRKAMTAIDPDGEWYSLGQLGQYLTRANPDFDSRTYGSAKLSDLLAESGAFEVKKGQGNHLDVRRRD